MKKGKTVIQMSAKRKNAPDLSDLSEAMAYRQIIVDLADVFKKRNMRIVAQHLQYAYREIDRIWEEDDFISS